MAPDSVAFEIAVSRHVHNRKDTSIYISHCFDK